MTYVTTARSRLEIFIDCAQRPAAVLLLLAGLLTGQNSFATNGYFAHGIGSKSRAMAGAGMAMPEDAIAVVNNPAVAVLVGDRIDLGLSAFIPRRNYTTSQSENNGENNAFTIGPANIDSSKDFFPIPEISLTRQLDNDAAFAVAFYMRSGMSTSYQGGFATFDPDGGGPLGVSTLPGVYGDGQTGMDFIQGYLDIAWAKRWGEKTSFGISAVLAAQRMEVIGIGGLARYTETFAASNGGEMPGQLSGAGRDYSYGVGLKVGLHRLLGDHFSLGLMYQTRIDMSAFDQYSDLFVDGGDIDIPAWFRMGLTWKPTDRVAVSLDIQNIWYSKVDALGNSFSNIYQCPSAGFGGADLNSCLGGNNGPGLGWNDVPIYSLGVSWDVTKTWTLRLGLSGSDQPTPFPENTFNILSPTLTEVHYTAGFSRKLNNGHELSFAFMYTEEESIDYPNQLDQSQTILLTTDQFDFEISYSWKF